MSETLSATYQRNAVVQDRAELDQWLAETETATTAAPAAKPPKEEKPAKPSALKAGGEAALTAANEGAAKALQGFWDIFRYTPPHPEDVGKGAVKEVASSMVPKAKAVKDIFDGVMAVIFSPAAGAQAASLQAELNMNPERARSQVLPGGPGGTGPLLRTMLGGDPKDTAPMTYGELASSAVALATMGVMSHRAPKGERAPVEVPKIPEPAERVPPPQPALAAGEAPKALEAGPTQKALPAGTTAIPQGAGEAVPGQLSLPPGEPVKMLAAGETQRPMPSALEAGARRYGLQPQEFFADVLKGTEADFEAILGGKPAEGPLRTAVDVAAEKTAPLDQMPSASDAAMRRARDLLDERGAADPAVLARIAVGAAIGCATGEDVHDCATRALVGAGVGSVLSRKMAAAVAQRIKGVPETVAEKSSQRSGVAVQASEQPFQPNYQRLDMTPAVKNLMVNVHRSIKEDILERRGPAKTNDAAVTEALRRIETEKFTPERVLTLGDEEVLSREDITAARILTKRAFEQAIETRDQILKGQPVPEGSYKQQIALAGAMGRNTRVAQTRIAQSQQASAIKIGNERVSYRPEDVAHLAENIEPGMTDQQLAMLHSTIKSPDQMSKVGTFMSVFPRAALQAMYFSYLSGKATLRNVVGNATMMGLDVIDTGIGRYMPTWDKKPGIMPGEATLRARALGEGLIDHVRMIRHLDMLDAEAVRLGFGDSVVKSERRAPAMKDLALSLGAEEGGTIARLGDWADRVTTFPGTVLDRTDIVAKAINGRMELHSQAMYQAAREGRAGDKFWERVGELTDDPTQLNQGARQRIIEVGEEATFTKEFESNLMRSLSAGPENQWLNMAYRGFVMPFFRVVARMTEQGMARTPGLNIVAKQFWDDWNAGGVRRQKAEARVVGGAAVIGSFMYLESQGLVTGTAPKDPKLRALWQKAGYQERAFWDPISDKWRSYDGLGPLTSLVSTAADTSMAARKLPESDAAHLFFAYFLSTVNNLDSRTFTQSISNLMDVIKNPSSDSQVEKAMDFLRKQAAGWAKPGVVREIETLVDPEVRRPVRSGAYDEDSLSGSLGREFQMLLDEVRAGWPGFSDAKDAEGNFLVPPDRDPLTGDPTIVESWPFNPFPGRAPKPMPFAKPDNAPKGVAADVRQELLRLNGAGIEPLPDWIGGSNPGAGAGFGPANTQEGIRLTGQAKDRWVELMTRGVKDGAGRTYAQALKATMEDQTYWEQSDGLRGRDGGKAVMLQAVETEFRTMATEQLYAEAPGIKRRVLARQAERAIQKAPTQQQPDLRDAVQKLIQSLPGR